jgi:hypothetical protein
MKRKVFAITYLLTFALFPWLVLSPSIDILANIPLRLTIFCLVVIASAFLFHQTWSGKSWGMAILFTSLGHATAYKLASFIPDISSYPFSLAWSEASRYYYASLWLSKQIYGFFVPPSVLHPTRYLLQSIPFLFSNSPLWFSRVWQVILWIASASLTSGLLIRRLALPAHRKSLVFSLSLLFWGFLFQFQGPVYFHLLFMAILILWGFDRVHIWRSLIVVLIASLWAGISRVNWVPVPGLLAAALYLMEVELKGKPLWNYILPPAIWVLAGTATGFASQQAYQLWSGNPPAWFGSSFTSDLLWYRLLPNPTYPLGILPSAVLVSLPLIGLMVLKISSRWHQYHFIRLLGLAAILGVLFVGGVIVSVKIGGGSNLHNLDAYLTLLLVTGSYIYFDRFQPDTTNQLDKNAAIRTNLSPGALFRFSEGIFIFGALAIPMYFTLSAGGQLPRHDFAAAQEALQTINSTTQQTANDGGEVLFISQRQLLTFNYVKDVPLVADYELVFLMEMAMSDNPSYMDAFHTDIANQRFAMIVSEPLVIQFQGRNHGFGEENDAWVTNVSEPVLCYYEPSVTLESVGVVLYIPRQNPCK